MSGVEWWVPWALAFCALVFAAGVLFLAGVAARGVWRLFHPGGAHAGGPVPERLWPLVDDGRAGSMILAEERALTPLPPPDWREVAHEEDWRDQTRTDLSPAALDSGPGEKVTSLAPPGPDSPGDGHGARGEPATSLLSHGASETPVPRTDIRDELGPRALEVLARYERNLGARKWALAV